MQTENGSRRRRRLAMFCLSPLCRSSLVGALNAGYAGCLWHRCGSVCRLVSSSVFSYALLFSLVSFLFFPVLFSHLPSIHWWIHHSIPSSFSSTGGATAGPDRKLPQGPIFSHHLIRSFIGPRLIGLPFSHHLPLSSPLHRHACHTYHRPFPSLAAIFRVILDPAHPLTVSPPTLLGPSCPISPIPLFRLRRWLRWRWRWWRWR